MNYSRTISSFLLLLSSSLLIANEDGFIVDPSGLLIAGATELKTDGSRKQFFEEPTYEFKELYNSTFLRQPDAVEAYLKTKGFEKIEITTENHTLEGMFLNRLDAKKVVISLAGFLPGKMTGMATLYAMIPDDCNLLFINLRGKGNSTGRNDLCKIWRYGVDEYQDVISTLEWYNRKHPDHKIIIHGICAGSFHGLKAIHHLAQEKNRLITDGTITGMIVDGGFASIEAMSKTAIPKTFMTIFGTKSILSTCISAYVGIPLCALYAPLRSINYLLANRWYADQLTITKTMMKAMPKNMRFLFIHGTEDELAPWENIKQLVNELPKDQVTIKLFDSDKHGSLHLGKTAKVYLNEFRNFVKKSSHSYTNSTADHLNILTKNYLNIRYYTTR